MAAAAVDMLLPRTSGVRLAVDNATMQVQSTELDAHATAAVRQEVGDAVDQSRGEFEKQEAMLMQAVTGHAEREGDLPERINALEKRIEPLDPEEHA